MLRKSKLEGFSIPGMAERLTTTLFADNTTVYLRQSDSWAALHGILERWCRASAAKFNIDKTKLLPIGSERYRNTVLTTRKINPTQDAIPQNIHIVADGMAERSLGCFIGNNIDAMAQWEATLSKIEEGTDRWGSLHPTLNGKRHIGNFIIAGCSQYKAKVQEIPKGVEKKLIKKMRTFMWNSETAPPLALRKL
ncbi:hypothetical protein GGG16DRAFT_36958, partial [Schizophyllum commune]